LPDAESQEKRHQHQLTVIGVANPELGGNVAEGGQHRVDGEGDQ
jgi:hypothetical protein